MSWQSTLDYYRLINEIVAARLGGMHSAKIVLHSVDFDEIERCQSAGDWALAGDILGRAARGLQLADAHFLLICTNTMHMVADRIQTHTSLPILHIGDVTAQAIRTAGLTKVALLGTRYTLTQPFLKARLADAHITPLIPAQPDIETVNRIIFDELCHGEIRNDSRTQILSIIDSLIEQGAEGVVLGCTELPLLIKANHCSVPIFDTTTIHASAAAELSMSDTLAPPNPVTK